MPEILGTQYESALDTEKKLSLALKEQENAALELNKIAIPYGALQREVESDRAVLIPVNNRLRETTVSLGIEKSPFRIVEEPLAASEVTASIPKMVVSPVSWSRARCGHHIWSGSSRQ